MCKKTHLKSCVLVGRIHSQGITLGAMFFKTRSNFHELSHPSNKKKLWKENGAKLPRYENFFFEVAIFRR
jgi:hypothetical protein